MRFVLEMRVLVVLVVPEVLVEKVEKGELQGTPMIPIPIQEPKHGVITKVVLVVMVVLVATVAAVAAVLVATVILCMFWEQFPTAHGLGYIMT